MTMSDRIAVINAGQLMQIAPPLECYNEPANLFVAGFIGSPSMNFVEADVGSGELKTENFTIEFDPATTDRLAPGDRVTIGVRPENVYLERTAAGVEHRSARIDARTDVLEPMGNEVFVYLVTGDDADTSMDVEGGAATDDQLLMSVDPDTQIEIDEDVSVILDRSKVHLFDPESGNALRHGLIDATSTTGTPERGVGDTD